MTAQDPAARRRDDRQIDLSFTALLLAFALPMAIGGTYAMFLEIEGSLKAMTAVGLLLPASALGVLVVWVLRNPLHEPARRVAVPADRGR